MGANHNKTAVAVSCFFFFLCSVSVLPLTMFLIACQCIGYAVCAGTVGTWLATDDVCKPMFFLHVMYNCWCRVRGSSSTP